MKLQSLNWNWKDSIKLKRSNFGETFQLQKKLSNFSRFFPTSIGSFQLRSVLSNFAWLFPNSAKLSNFSFFPTALSNYTHPDKIPGLHGPLWSALLNPIFDCMFEFDTTWRKTTIVPNLTRKWPISFGLVRESPISISKHDLVLQNVHWSKIS